MMILLRPLKTMALYEKEEIVALHGSWFIQGDSYYRGTGFDVTINPETQSSKIQNDRWNVLMNYFKFLT
jgi:hypothetical protein